MKSTIVLTLASFSFLVLTPVIGVADTMSLPNGSNTYGEIDAAILCVTSRLSKTDFDVQAICEKIAQVDDEGACRRYFMRLLDVAYSIRFEDCGDIHVVDFDERQRIFSKLGFAYVGLERLSMEVWKYFWSHGASQKEQFSPLFRYAEKMKIEAERLGKEGKGLSLGLDVIERIYGINQKSGNGSPGDFAWVEENFRRISGRQIRTENQVDADNRAEATRKGIKPSR